METRVGLKYFGIDCRSCYSILSRTSSGLELASTITLELQANPLTKYDSPYQPIPRTQVSCTLLNKSSRD